MYWVLTFFAVFSVGLAVHPFGWHTETFSGTQWNNLGGHSAPAINDHLFYVAFGFTESITSQPNVFYNNVYRVNIKTETVTLLQPSTSTVPDPRTFPNCYTVNQKLKCFGGVTYVSTAFPQLIKSYNDIWQFSPLPKIWTNLNPAGILPEPRNSASTVFVDGKFWVYGGIGGQDNSFNYKDFGDMWYYDDNDNVWVNVTSQLNTNTFENGQPVFPGRRYAAASTLCGDDDLWYIVGGESLGPSGFLVREDIWSFEFATLTFTRLPVTNPLVNRRFRSAVCFGDVIFVHGNYYPDGRLTTFNVTNEDNIFDLDTNTWCPYHPNPAGPFLNRNGITKMGRKVYTTGGFDFEYLNATFGVIHWDNNIHWLRLRRHLACN